MSPLEIVVCDAICESEPKADLSLSNKERLHFQIRIVGLNFDRSFVEAGFSLHRAAN
jgi:hypothetical protein